MQLTIATGFNFAPAWAAVRLSVTDVAGGGNGLSGTSVLESSTLSVNSSELVNNWLKQIGDDTFKGRLTLNQFSTCLASIIQGNPLNGQFYTPCKFDIKPPAGGLSQEGLFVGSHLDSGGGSFNSNAHWLKYEPLADNSLVVHAIRNVGNYLLDIDNNDTPSDPIEGTTRVKPNQFDVAYVFDQRRGLLGFYLTTDRGFIAKINCDRLYRTSGQSIPSNIAYYLIPPEIGLNVPLRTHGKDYNTTFDVTPVNAGRAYGVKQPDLLLAADRISANSGTQYPNDSSGVASSQQDTPVAPAHGFGADFNRILTTIVAVGAGAGLKVDYTAAAGVIDNDSLRQGGGGDSITSGKIYQVTELGKGQDYSPFGGPDAVNSTPSLIFKATSGGNLAGAEELLQKGVIAVDAGEGYVNNDDIFTIKGSALVLTPTGGPAGQGGGNNTPLDGVEYRVNADGVGKDWSKYVDTDGVWNIGNTGPPTSAALGDTFFADTGGNEVLNSEPATGGGGSIEAIGSESNEMTVRYFDQSLLRTIEPLAITNANCPLIVSDDGTVTRQVTIVNSKTGLATGLTLTTVIVANVLQSFEIDSNGTNVEDGDEFSINGTGGATITVKRFHNGIATAALTGAGTGLIIDFRKDILGKLVEFKTQVNGIAYESGDEVRVIGGHGAATLDITASLTNIPVDTDGAGVGMTVDITVGQATVWEDGTPISDFPVEEVRINQVGTDYKSGDIQAILAGDSLATFGLAFLPEYEGNVAVPVNRNIINQNPALAWDRIWYRHTRVSTDTAGGYKFRMANSSREVVDMDGKGLPFVGDHRITFVHNVRGLSLTACDLNIWEYTDDEIQGLNLGSGTNPESLDLNGNFDPEGSQASIAIDDLEAHARVMPSFDKKTLTKTDPLRETVEIFELPSLGNSGWTDSAGGTGQSVFEAVTDGRDDTFARSGVNELGLSQVEGRSFFIIAQEVGLICDEVVGHGGGTSKVTDPDGEIIAVVFRKGGANPVEIQGKLTAGDAGAVGAFIGKGNADFDAANWVKDDGLGAGNTLQIGIKRIP